MKKIFLFLTIITIITLQNCDVKEEFYIKITKPYIYKIDYNRIKLPSNNEKHITIGFIEKINNFNPYLASSHIEIFLKKALFTTLFYIDPFDNSIKKNLIDSYYISENGIELKFNLKKNITSNNRVLTSDDVITSLLLLNTHLKKSHFYNKFFITNKELKLEKIDDFQFKIILDKPNSNILYSLTDYPISAKDDIYNIKDFNDFIFKFMDYSNISLSNYGPYKIKFFDSKNIILVKNKEYFKKDKPYTEEIRIKIYSSINELILAFINGEIDILEIEKEEDFNNLYNYITNNKITDIKIIDTNERMTKLFLLMNENINLEMREQISDLIFNNLEQKYSISSNIINNNKRLKFKNFYKKDLNELIFIKYDNNFIKNISEDIIKILKENGFSIKEYLLPSYQYMKKIFIDKEFDLTLISYSFNNDILSYYNFFFNPDYGFNNFYKEEITKEFDYIFKTYDITKHKERLSYIFNILEKNGKLNLVFNFKKYYLINSKIYNFYINSLYEEDFNLITFENIVKNK